MCAAGHATGGSRVGSTPSLIRRRPFTLAAHYGRGASSRDHLAARARGVRPGRAGRPDELVRARERRLITSQVEAVGPALRSSSTSWVGSSPRLAICHESVAPAFRGILSRGASRCRQPGDQRCALLIHWTGSTRSWPTWPRPGPTAGVDRKTDLSWAVTRCPGRPCRGIWTPALLQAPVSALSNRNL